MTDDLVKMVFDRGEGEIPGATVIDLVAAEGFFELCEAVPGVFGVRMTMPALILRYSLLVAA